GLTYRETGVHEHLQLPLQPSEDELLRSLRPHRGSQDDEVAQGRVLDEDPPKGAEIVPQVIVPGVTGGRGHDLVELCGGLLDKRGAQSVLSAEVQVDTGDSFTEMECENRHTQLIDHI